MYVTSSIENDGFDLTHFFFCQEKVFTKENFRKTHQKSRKLGCKKYNCGAICSEINKLNNKKISLLLQIKIIIVYYIILVIIG